MFNCVWGFGLGVENSIKIITNCCVCCFIYIYIFVMFFCFLNMRVRKKLDVNVVCCFSEASQFIYDPKYCYILDGFLLIYGIIITAFFVHERVSCAVIYICTYFQSAYSERTHARTHTFISENISIYINIFCNQNHSVVNILRGNSVHLYNLIKTALI